jgi:hypothetical protein
VHSKCIITAVAGNYLQGDEAELAKKIATLKWHSKEMEVCANYSAYFICAAKMPIHEIYLF